MKMKYKGMDITVQVFENEKEKKRKDFLMFSGESQL